METELKVEPLTAEEVAILRTSYPLSKPTLAGLKMSQEQEKAAAISLCVEGLSRVSNGFYVGEDAASLPARIRDEVVAIYSKHLKELL